MDRLLIIGSGDVALRAMPWLRQRFRVYALVRRAEAAAQWRLVGAVPVSGDLDDAASLRRLGGLADVLLHCAPPPEGGQDDPRMRRLLAALQQRGQGPRCIVYVSTSGVYGDCAGARVDESHPLRPATARARRRVAAERCLRAHSIASGCALCILRAPGIYAAERLSLARLQRGDPVLQASEDVFTNHIHAADLARAAGLALFRGPHLRIFNVCDDSQLAMGDYYDAMADIFGLARPPRLSRAECAQHLSPVTLSFMSESRRLDNTRIRRELRWSPRFADVRDGLAAACAELQSQGQ
ncbi:NAD-dependent epimerase/dehydratase family protein [Uliginosibacterium aquaticum]|uniref:NAD-dependent epimerase/dehydratase family protein n=1 Tax=Uliginosibacterium aquaticum TaxID=2731212 RepID=A0ABX2IE52_9RHOO|nr:NAD-dependent epimerase/dehydratase family protein [Uliginosibacterium aquaticum]NSL54058.1 NAD-dependent epimerase/dehydratase family protein [Uliginosibacterium aquaticum]